MTFQPGANLYTQGFGSRPEGVEVPHIEIRDPSPSDINYPIGKTWLNTSTEEQFILYKFQVSNGITQAVWASPVGPSGAVVSLSDTGNTKTFPDASGDIQLVGVANQTQIVSNPSIHDIQIGLTNPLNVQAFNSSGPVNLATTTNNDVTIGSETSTEVQVTINGHTVFTGTEIDMPNALLDLLNLQVTGDAQIQDRATFSGAISYNGSHYQGATPITLIGDENTLYCNTIPSPLTFTITSGSFPVDGAELVVIDTQGNASVNNITINVTGTDQIVSTPGTPSTSLILSGNYECVIMRYTTTGTNNIWIVIAS